MVDVLTLVGVDSATTLGNLLPAFEVIRQMAGTCEYIRFGRERCKNIVQRAALIVKEVRGNMRNGQNDIMTFQRKLEEIQVTLQKFADMSFFKALLRFEDINKEIERANRQLSDCLKLFPISSFSLHSQAQRQAATQAARSDQDTLQALLKILEGNYEEIRRRFDLNSDDQVNQAMAVMERGLRKIASKDDTVEVQIMQRSLNCIKSTTGRSAPKQQRWLITEYDLDDCGVIGGGGFAIVSKARFRGTIVAVKTFRDAGNMREVLEHEVEIWSRLHHDHIVPFYGASVLTFPHFIVSRYMQNGNLVQYLAAIQNADRTKLLFEVSLGMYYLHEEDVVHGDLKAVNVLVDDSGKACITDFGLSKVCSSGTTVTETGKVTGTLRYLAPEALSGEPLCFNTDVYAFGMLIYEIFTGEVPFSREPDQMVIEGRVELKRPISDRVYERGFNNALWELLSRCISRTPTGRPQFKTIQDDLDLIQKTKLTDQLDIQDKNVTDWGLTRMSIDITSSSSDKGKSRLVEHHDTSSGGAASQDIEILMPPAESQSNSLGRLCYSPTMFDSSASAPLNEAKVKPEEQPSSSQERPTPRNIRAPLEILPMCIVVTHKFFDVPFEVSSRKPGAYLEKANVFHWQPIVAEKGTLLYEQENKFFCRGDTGNGQNSWELNGNEITIRTSSFVGVCRFKDAQKAEKWFKLQLSYVRDGSVRGWDTAIGDWFRTDRSWRRLERGKIQEASLIEGVPKAVPTDRYWSNIDLPKRCVINSCTGAEIVCNPDPGKRSGKLCCKLDGCRIVYETRRLRGNTQSEQLVMSKEEVYPSAEYAQVTFRVLKMVLEKAAEKKNRSLFSFSSST